MTDQPLNVNEEAFALIRQHLDATDAPAEVREALDGLETRWRLGREIQQMWRQRYREVRGEAA